MTIDHSGIPPRRRFICLLVLMLLAGCSDSPEKTYPVQGVVTLDGKPLVGVCVLFESIERGKKSGRCYTARATIDAEGRYRLSTFGRYDGAVAGRHRAVVLADQSRMTDDPNAPLPITVPIKYSAPDTTDLEYEVQPRENAINIDLHSDDTSK